MILESSLSYYEVSCFQESSSMILAGGYLLFANCRRLMLDQTKAEQIFKRVKSFASAGELEIIFSSTNYALTRFANNTIHQNVAELNEVASIRVAFDGKTARATTNRFDDESLKRAVRSAENIAKFQEPDANHLPLAKADETKREE